MKRVFAIFVSVLFTVSLLALTPQKIYFQAVIRDASNNIVVSHSVGMQISILQGTVDGTVEYLEVQTPTTDLNGIVSIEIGGGPGFNDINWSTGSYFIKTETDPTGGTNYTLTGTSKLLSVPYSLHSYTADSLTSVISETDPVFLTSPAFAITAPDINNWNTAYSWGNHAGLYSLLGHTHSYLPLIGGEMVNTNIVTNLNSDLLDGQHGSFYAPAKGSDNYISNQDSSAQTANLRISGNGTFGGKVYVNGIQTIFVPNQTNFEGSLVIGTGGLNLTNSPPNSLWPESSSVNNGKQNTFVGIDAGRENTSGNQNTFVGMQAGRDNMIGDQNTFIGMNAGMQNTTGYHNSFVGAWAGQSNTTGSRNAFLGTDTGNYNSTGSENAFFGNAAGVFNTTGSGNSFFGLFSGTNNNSDNNSFFGRSSGFTNTTGENNCFFGSSSGYYNISGFDNSFFGCFSGISNETGTNNVFVGRSSFFSNKSGSYNVGLGNYTGSVVNTGNYNTFIGSNSGASAYQKTDVINSTAIGYETFTTKDNQIVIGNINNLETLLFGKIGIGNQEKVTSTTGISLGSGSSAIEFVGSNWANGYGHIIRSIDNGDSTGVDLRISGRANSLLWSDLVAIKNRGNVGIGYTTGNEINSNKLAVNGSGYFNGNITATTIKLTKGNVPNAILICDKDSLGTWKTLKDAGIATYSGAPNYIQNRNDSVQRANMWISGNGAFDGRVLVGNQAKNISMHGLSLGFDNSSIEFVGSNWANGYGHIIRSIDSGDGTGVDLRISGRSNSFAWTDFVAIKNKGNIGIGYFTGSEINNNKLAVNGNVYINGIITAIGGKSTDWNTAYTWGNHAGLYRPISYVPSWTEIISNPFVFNNVVNDQLIRYSSITSKWENWTPNFLTSFTEADPYFAAWDKTSGIKITASQIIDLQASITNNPTVLANASKNTYPLADAIKLASVATGAEVNVNADWNATSGDAQILNKPKGNNSGDMQYWNGSEWMVIPAGQPGQFLQFTSSNIPAWTTVLPILTTATVSDITTNAIKSGGNVITDGGGIVTERGVCWSTFPNPTIVGSKTLDGTGKGLFTSSVTGLTAGTTYYIRAYATNSSFTAYGNEVRFLTTLN